VQGGDAVQLWESMYRDVLDETGFNAVVEGDERLFQLTYHKLSHSANGGDASLLEPHDAASLGAETLAGLLLDSKSGASAAVTVRGSRFDNDRLPGPADARAGCAFRVAVEQAPNWGTVHARAGVHRWQWQASLLEIADLAEQTPEGEPMRIFPPDEWHHTWLWEDALIVPWRCAQHVRGESPHLTVLWGRWQLQKASIGSFARAALMAEVPIRSCETVEVLGAWAFRECEVRCAAGTALAVDNKGRAVLEVCGVGGDGDGRRQAHRAVRASASADVSLHDCVLDRVGYHREAAGVVGTDSASVKVLRCQLRLLDVAVSLSWHARVALAQCVLERCLPPPSLSAPRSQKLSLCFHAHYGGTAGLTLRSSRCFPHERPRSSTRSFGQRRRKRTPRNTDAPGARTDKGRELRRHRHAVGRKRGDSCPGGVKTRPLRARAMALTCSAPGQRLIVGVRRTRQRCASRQRGNVPSGRVGGRNCGAVGRVHRVV